MEIYVNQDLMLVIKRSRSRPDFKGFAFKSEDFVDEGIPVVKASNIKIHKVQDIQSYICLSNQQFAFEKYRLKPGDIVISTVGSKPEVTNSAVGQLCYIEDGFNNSYLNQNTVCIRPNSSLNKRFLKHIFASKYIRNEFDRRALWIANQAYLEVDEILDISIIFPNQLEQLKIVEYLDAIDKYFEDVTVLQLEQIEALKEYKTTLINSAVTGKIKVV